MEIFQFKFDVAMVTRGGRIVLHRLYAELSYAYSYNCSNTMRQNLDGPSKIRMKS